MTLQEQLGDALYETHGIYCQELIDAGYDLDAYYDGGKKWGDFDRVLALVCYLRGASSYYEYEVAFSKLGQGDDAMVSRNLWARLTGLTKTQTERTNSYRQRQSAELAELRALRWIDEHLEQATNYINNKN